MWVATASESFKKIFHPWVERAVVGTKTHVVHVKQLLEMVLDNLFERVGRTAGAVARGGKCRQGGWWPPPSERSGGSGVGAKRYRQGRVQATGRKGNLSPASVEGEEERGWGVSPPRITLRLVGRWVYRAVKVVL